MPEFMKSHRGLVIDVSCTYYSCQSETWYADTTQDWQEFTKVKFTAAHFDSNEAMVYGRDQNSDILQHSYINLL